MRRLLPTSLSLALMFIVLFGCSSQSKDITKVSVSQSTGFGAINQDFFDVFEGKPTIAIQIFETAIISAVKQDGIVNMASPEYDLKVEYSDGSTQGFHLWLGEEGQNSTLMYIEDSHTIYSTPSDMTSKLSGLLQSH